MKSILKQVKKIEIKTKKLVDGLISGNYHSIFKGQGIEFSEIREYKPGDDIRAIDWKVTARFDRPFIKEFIEERDLRVMFLFDISSSNEFGNKISKNQKAIELIATLMFSAMQNNDNVGMILFSDKIEKYIPLRKGKKHVLSIISQLLSYKPESKNTDIKNTLSHTIKMLKRRSIIFMVSDFISKDFSRELQILKNKHDVIAINLLDNRELSIPDVGLILLEDEETGEQIEVNTSDIEFRKRYKEIIKDQQDKTEIMFRRFKIDKLDIKTDEEYIIPLKKFFALRQHRVNR